ncbi:MAG: hypothetical protein AMK73_08755 [Planctomycetes bacterium SM23_32]|nr:MAG: hypothetical protein AMK73_08755 [Planctomycetes bacterium SM23_32]
MTDGNPTEEPQARPPEQPERDAKKATPWPWILAAVVTVLALALVPAMRLMTGQDWTSDPMLATYILSGSIIALELALIILLKTARTRYSVERKIQAHREVNEYVILWDRPRWVLFTPSLVTGLLFGICTILASRGLFPEAVTPRMLGGIWVVLCVLNVLVEQFHMSIKAVLILVPTLGALLLALHLVGYAGKAVRLLRHAAVEVEPKLYFTAAFVIALVIFIGWLHGLFHYMAITPNVADLQRGLTETGRQIKNADYDVDFDATDVVERWLFGFGRIIISFRDPSRPPMVFFVPQASVVDERIRRVRSVTAIDRVDAESA